MWLPAEGNTGASNNSSSNIVGNSNSNSNSENSGSTDQQNIPTDKSGLEIFALHVLNDSHKSLAGRSRVIQEWAKGGGVLLIGYELYRQLSLKRPNKSNTKKRRRKFQEEIVDVDEDDRNKALLEEMHAALVKPGPDLVICDEGHRIKNSHASISQALKQIRSKRRVVLTGYPLQNNLLEYWCMVDFVRPNYLGTKTEFCNMFERPIQNGQCIDSTPQDIRLMRYRAHVLHSLLEGFVQRRSHSVLQVTLPQKEEYVLLLRMTTFQRKLYDTFMNEVVRTKAVPNPLKAFAVCCKIWNHPDVLYYFLKKRSGNEDVDLDLEETTGAATTPLNAGGVDQKERERVQQHSARRNTVGTSQSPVGNQQSQGNQNQMINSQASIGTQQNTDYNAYYTDSNWSFTKYDLNLNEGKHLVELGTGSARGFNIKEDPGIPYDWAVDLLKNYIPGSIENSAKMEVLFLYS
ncbi:hypothetical protein L9F63_026162 [Diploptera punctata]|uniref:SNF2 N-terminal domain-containing protein n=1 Tax=Diploptera punctata TaxID=6984 RepID=A0AAD8ERN9_DIPPU|nr:hypothetical protein L9F63_026162 [Diploptera punctata]